MRLFAAQAAGLLLYYAVLTIVYKRLEGWVAVEAVYFITCTLTTVGYGDIAARTKTGRLFVAPVMVLGVFLVLAPLAQFVRAVTSLWKVREAPVPVESYGPEVVAARARRVEVRKYALEVWPLFFVAAATIFVSTYDADTTILDALYFATQTFFTIGYGDVTQPLTTDRRRLFISVCMLFLVVFASNLYSDLAKIQLERVVREKRSFSVDLEAIVARKVQRRQRNVVTEADFVLEALEQQNLVDPSVLLSLRRYYHWRVRAASSLEKADEDFHPSSNAADEITLRELYERRSSTGAVTFEDWLDTYWEPKVATDAAALRGNAHRRPSRNLLARAANRLSSLSSRAAVIRKATAVAAVAAKHERPASPTNARLLSATSSFGGGGPDDNKLPPFLRETESDDVEETPHHRRSPFSVVEMAPRTPPPAILSSSEEEERKDHP